MKIVILGLGYVGSTVMACLLQDGHEVVGIDVSPEKVAAIRAGHAPISEPGVAELLAIGVAEGRATADAEAVSHLATADLAMVCVGTPSKRDGGLNLSQVVAVAGEIGRSVRRRPPGKAPLLVAFRSTMPPGSMESAVLPALAAGAGEPPGARYEPAINPEFLREGTAIRDYRNPPKIVIGERRAGATAGLGGIYAAMDAPLFEVSFAEAEFVKFADNSFHAAKVVFANEIGRLCLEFDVDPQVVMDIFLSDTKLNVSPYYLRPGGAFGGSCLPKDVRALVSVAARLGMRTPLIDALIPSNEAHKTYLTERVLAALPPGGSVLQVGLSFKPATDDLRESPLVYLARTLVEEECPISIYDPDILSARLVGANLAFARDRLPDLYDLLVPDVEVIPLPDLVVMGKPLAEPLPARFAQVPRIDLHRLAVPPAAERDLSRIRLGRRLASA